MSGWKALRVWAEMYEDSVKSLTSNKNRAARGGVDKESYQFALKAHEVAKDTYGKALVKTYKAVVPVEIREWAAETTGIGEHVLARLLGVTGHPVHATRHFWAENADYDPSQPASETNPKRILVEGESFDRTLSQWWSYCGHGDPKRKRREGMTQEQALALGNPRAKSLAHQMAVYCVMAKGGEDKNGKPRPRSPYRDVYDEARELYATRESTDEDRWTDLRRKNAAERKVAKEILRDLWEVARGS